MAKHNIAPAALTSLENDRAALLAAVDALPALRSAKLAAIDALETGEGHVASLLEKIAHAGFHGLDVKDPPPKMSASPTDTAEAPRASAVRSAVNAAKSKLSNLK